MRLNSEGNNNAVGLSGWYSELSSGLDHQLAAGESQVSGGQDHCLQLARLFYKNVHYVLLDEALSALDSTNRKEIIKHLDSYLTGKTVLWITHNSDVMNSLDNVVNISEIESLTSKTLLFESITNTVRNTCFKE